MTMHSALLAAHIGAGTIGLVLGPLAMVARKGPGAHPRLGVVYQAAIAVLAASAVGLVSLAPARLWGFAIIAVGTEAAALGGWAMARRRPPGWLPVHISLMAGSYVSLVTALLVVNWSSPLAWIVPTVIGTPWIAARASRSAGRSRRPEGDDRFRRSRRPARTLITAGLLVSGCTSANQACTVVAEIDFSDDARLAGGPGHPRPGPGLHRHRRYAHGAFRAQRT